MWNDWWAGLGYITNKGLLDLQTHVESVKRIENIRNERRSSDITSYCVKQDSERDDINEADDTWVSHCVKSPSPYRRTARVAQWGKLILIQKLQVHKWKYRQLACQRRYLCLCKGISWIHLWLIFLSAGRLLTQTTILLSKFFWWWF